MKRVMFILLSLGLSFPLWAGGAFDEIPPGKWWENPRLVETLQLSEAQQRQIHQQVYEHAVRMIDLKAAVERAELVLKNTAEQDELRPAAVRSAFADFQQARLKLESERFEMLLAVRQLLSSEQWQQLQQLRERFEHRRGDPRGRLGGPPGGPPRRGDRGAPPDEPRPDDTGGPPDPPRP